SVRSIAALEGTSFDVSVSATGSPLDAVLVGMSPAAPGIGGGATNVETAAASPASMVGTGMSPGPFAGGWWAHPPSAQARTGSNETVFIIVDGDATLVPLQSVAASLGNGTRT